MSRTAGISNIPQEILEEILDLLGPEFWKAGSLISNAFRDACQRRIFSKISFGHFDFGANQAEARETAKLQSLLNVLDNSRRLARYVRFLNVRLHSGKSETLLAHLFHRSFPLLVNLEQFDGEAFGPSIDLSALSKLNYDATLPKMRQIFLRGFTTFPPRFLAQFPNLQFLDLVQVGFGQIDEQDEIVGQSKTSSDALERPKPRVWRVKPWKPVDFQRFFTAAFKDARFSHQVVSSNLTALTLDCWEYCRDCEEQEWVQSHQAFYDFLVSCSGTLERLHIAFNWYHLGTLTRLTNNSPIPFKNLEEVYFNIPVDWETLAVRDVDDGAPSNISVATPWLKQLSSLPSLQTLYLHINLVGSFDIGSVDLARLQPIVGTLRDLKSHWLTLPDLPFIHLAFSLRTELISDRDRAFVQAELSEFINTGKLKVHSWEEPHDVDQAWAYGNHEFRKPYFYRPLQRGSSIGIPYTRGDYGEDSEDDSKDSEDVKGSGDSEDDEV
ncbi:hypothetical protein CC1G_05235 [Coprinopsis cinerea okayama7|uniref:F-box domain-containing protein n=1 Tax=Coprinopsis cinerea (strain Okayama-7 / 130 / ATCC MYA-4618 / FGSC 9003) TaxID=240176 RepID=A8PCA0_COPC7|nr:hypothetical protein CC1G_05235 [Coprinopsis cinerea okayama7\|eukprot:XP_001840349.1 hypothetical protein CC1G_05235 [Coprinopsis cinerea okayama7\